MPGGGAGQCSAVQLQTVSGDGRLQTGARLQLPRLAHGQRTLTLPGHRTLHNMGQSKKHANGKKIFNYNFSAHYLNFGLDKDLWCFSPHVLLATYLTRD